MNCSDNQKVNYAVFMLVGEAKYWWDSTRRLLERGGIIITWEVFRAKFFEKYYPNDVRRAKEIKFMQLKQGNMTVYASKFEELGKYSVFFYHPNERMKCIKFEDGLRPELRKLVGILEISDFPTLIHKCYFLEGFDHNKDNRPKSFGPQFHKKRNNEEKLYDRPQWKPQSSQFAENSSRPMNNQVKCLKCGQVHYTKDLKPSHVFSECGQPKAYANTSRPKPRPTTTGRVYTMTGIEAAQNNDLIQGTCFIKGKTLNVLYNSGTTHYADKRRQPLEFQEGDHVFLKVIPTTGIGRVMKSKKLIPRFIGPYRILIKIDLVAYQISLPPFLSNLHNVFHVSQLRKYISNHSHVIMFDTVQLKDNLTFEIMSVQIADKRIKQLRGKQTSLVKVI
uniref:Uncharacterized protein n=1 Tax=Cajanus cajan TaxID=3821 RepID=A0A151RT02_CAJCA|nr:hypothetical protein KK1_032812 [Cajanus cajan]